VHAILLDGRLLGHWRYSRDNRGVPAELQTWLYRVPSRAERQALDSAVARFGDFVGAALTWS
jgi:hypothetical protein